MGVRAPLRRSWTKKVLIAVAVVAAALAIFLAITSMRIVRQANGDALTQADAIVVFGAAEYSGRPSPVLKARLDHAHYLFLQGYAPLVIVTGGGAYDPLYTEGEVGRDYLRERGMPDVNLIAETQSDNTGESAQRVGVIMRANRMHTAIAVSDAYHIFRIKQMMARQGIRAMGAPRPGSLPRTWFGKLQGVLREAVSYTAWKLHLT